MNRGLLTLSEDVDLRNNYGQSHGTSSQPLEPSPPNPSTFFSRSEHLRYPQNNRQGESLFCRTLRFYRSIKKMHQEGYPQSKKKSSCHAAQTDRDASRTVRGKRKSRRIHKAELHPLAAFLQIAGKFGLQLSVQ